MIVAVEIQYIGSYYLPALFSLYSKLVLMAWAKFAKHSRKHTHTLDVLYMTPVLMKMLNETQVSRNHCCNLILFLKARLLFCNVLMKLSNSPTYMKQIVGH